MRKVLVPGKSELKWVGKKTSEQIFSAKGMPVSRRTKTWSLVPFPCYLSLVISISRLQTEYAWSLGEDTAGKDQ